jgi:hypothetical protein
VTDEPGPGSVAGGAEQARAARAAARAGWPVRRTTLAAQSTATAPPGSTPEQRLAMMWPLALDAWALAGRPLPDYPRREAPGRVIRARERGTR